MDPAALAPLPPSFFQDEAAAVARRLLGCLLCRRLEAELLIGRIVETEAYLPSGDGAAHQRRPRSAATASLYGPAGTAYVHRLRHHHLLDVVTRPPGQTAGERGGSPGGTVLLRALEPLAGLATMARLRGAVEPRRLTSGPGRLCRALAIDLALDGADLSAAALAAGGEPALFLAAPDPATTTPAIVAGRRIGIRAAAELPLRFLFAGNPWVSRRAAGR